MTKASWQAAEEKGLAGYFSCTCLPSALDCLYEDVVFPIWFYSFYTKAFRDQQRYGADKRRTKDVYQRIIQFISGSKNLKQISFKQARNEEETEDILEGARNGGFKVIICTLSLHVVGLEPITNGLWKMVGNGISTWDDLTSREVFRYLYLKKPLRKSRKDPNIYIFPSIK